MADDLELNPGSGGATAATDDIGGIHYQRVKIVHGADGVADGDVARSSPLPVDPEHAESIQAAHGSASSIAAGSSSDIDSTQISASKTGKLIGLVVGATVALKIELKTVTNGVASSTLLTTFSLPGIPREFKSPHKDAFTVAQDAGAGLDAFRVTVTNLDTSDAADAYATFIYDETA